MLSAKRQTAFIKQQNAVRGAIARYKSVRYGKDQARSVVQLRSDLLDVLNSAKIELATEQYAPFWEWLTSQLRNVVPDYELKSRLHNLASTLPLKHRSGSLTRELRWIAQYLKSYVPLINAFRALALPIEQLTSKGQYHEAIELLEQLSVVLGQSFWALNLRIALEQELAGLEGQKKFVDELRKNAGRSPLSFVAYFIGIRNERRTSWIRFVERLEKTLKRHGYPSDIKHYLRFRLTFEWPTSDSGIADVLRHEQSNGPVDLYEALVSLAQRAVIDPDLSNLRSSLSELLLELGDIDDFRIIKLLSFFGDASITDIPTRDSRVSDALFSKQPGRAVWLFAQLPEDQTSDPWQIIYRASALAHFDTEYKFEETLIGYFTELLASVLKRDRSCLTNMGLLEKALGNFSSLTTGAALRDFMSMLQSQQPGLLLTFSNVGLNSRFAGWEDRFESTERALPSGPTHFAWTSADQDVSGFSHLLKAIDAYHDEDYAAALESTDRLKRSTQSEPLRLLTATISLASQIQLGDKSATISHIADEASRNEQSPTLLPVHEALGDLQWNDFKTHAANLDAHIALHALWRITDNDAVTTLLRFAFSYQLKRSGFTRPSEFADHLDKFERLKVIYYLRHVCVPSIMDMSPAFTSSRQVIEERQAVCASLRFIDPGNSTEYEREIFDIDNNLAISDGLSLVDASRIHVDVDAISRWANNALSEDYARYCDLVQAGVAKDAGYEELERALSDIGAATLYYSPNDQTDSLLVDILNRLREEFLTNPTYGLDYFISKRIRHQSFIGLIRGPLEFAKLITSRESEFGPYKENEFWISQLSSLSSDDTEAVSEIFSEFADRFDALLIDIKNRLFQIKSPEKPQGLFDFSITPKGVLIARTLIGLVGADLGAFLRLAYSMFWGGLEPCLLAARTSITSALAGDVQSLFDRLKGDIGTVASSDPGYNKLAAKISEVSSEVQRNLDTAASWFIRSDSGQAVRDFTLRQALEIAVRSAKKSQRAFEPTIEFEQIDELTLQAADLLLLTDAIFIALDNVALHSGLKRDINVRISCAKNADEEILLSISNNIGLFADNEDTRATLSKIRNKIDSGTLGKEARLEGGSGLLKLAAALRHSRGGDLDFGFAAGPSFKLVIRLKLTSTVAVIIPDVSQG